ncbi:hypothetical protein GGI20_000867 [Coemansia sp. BCRC 34301]|nr:hypothetical protein GGI20_000867 [Coemansia sp. BCRC 34301]
MGITATVLALPLLACASPAMQHPPTARVSPGRPLPVPTINSSGNAADQAQAASATPSSSGYDYSFAVGLSGFDGSITHYSVSYSDPYVSGIVGVGHAEPTPTPPAATTVVNNGISCNKSFPGLLSGLGLDLGIRLNLLIIGIDACIAL